MPDSNKELRESYSLLTNVVNSSPDLIFVKDLNLRTSFAIQRLQLQWARSQKTSWA